MRVFVTISEERPHYFSDPDNWMSESKMTTLQSQSEDEVVDKNSESPLFNGAEILAVIIILMILVGLPTLVRTEGTFRISIPDEFGIALFATLFGFAYFGLLKFLLDPNNYKKRN